MIHQQSQYVVNYLRFVGKPFRTTLCLRDPYLSDHRFILGSTAFPHVFTHSPDDGKTCYDGIHPWTEFVDRGESGRVFRSFHLPCSRSFIRNLRNKAHSTPQHSAITISNRRHELESRNWHWRPYLATLDAVPQRRNCHSWYFSRLKSRFIPRLYDDSGRARLPSSAWINVQTVAATNLSIKQSEADSLYCGMSNLCLLRFKNCLDNRQDEINACLAFALCIDELLSSFLPSHFHRCWVHKSSLHCDLRLQAASNALKRSSSFSQPVEMRHCAIKLFNFFMI